MSMTDKEIDAYKKRLRYEANPERFKFHARKWQLANPEKSRAMFAAYNHRNREAMKARAVAWAKANREKVRAYSRAYYYRRKAAKAITV